ncbi:hypothetical protein C0584_03665 [Candidatus Parcubacteria bacterium]|nr:MAG: hypothetical protein C0584_03665 [Candidatus Parcubacteria bacterium]
MNEKNAMCPNCNILMDEVLISSHYKVNIPIDQCSRCGGLWFDELEHLRADHDEHKKFAKFDQEKFRGGFEINSKLLCPRDGQELRVLEDDYFTKEVEVEYCEKCYGFWFNSGEFETFQKQRKKKLGVVSKTKKDNLEEQLEAMFMAESVANKYNTIGNIGRSLSSPVSRMPGNIFYKKSHANDPIANLIEGIYLVITSLIRIISIKK